MCSFTQLIKGDTKGVTLEVGIVVVKGQAAQHNGIGLAEFLFGNISLLTKVYKNNQFKIKIIVFTAVFRFISIELSQVGQLLAVGLCLSGLWIYNLNNRSILVHILVYKGIVVCNLSIRYTLASKISFKAIGVYRTNLIKQVSYKVKNLIKFKRGKEPAKPDVIQDFLFSPFHLVFLT